MIRPPANSCRQRGLAHQGYAPLRRFASASASKSSKCCRPCSVLWMKRKSRIGACAGGCLEVIHPGLQPFAQGRRAAVPGARSGSPPFQFPNRRATACAVAAETSRKGAGRTPAKTMPATSSPAAGFRTLRSAISTTGFIAQQPHGRPQQAQTADPRSA